MAKELEEKCKSLEKLQSKYSDLSLLPTDVKSQPLLTTAHLMVFLKKLKHRTLLIPVIGTGSAGKTTLLNAILGEK